MLESCIGYGGKLPKNFSYNPSLDFKQIGRNIKRYGAIGLIIIGATGLGVGINHNLERLSQDFKKDVDKIVQYSETSSALFRLSLKKCVLPYEDVRIIKEHPDFKYLKEYSGLNEEALLGKIDEYWRIIKEDNYAEPLNDFINSLSM